MAVEVASSVGDSDGLVVRRHWSSGWRGGKDAGHWAWLLERAEHTFAQGDCFCGLWAGPRSAEC